MTILNRSSGSLATGVRISDSFSNISQFDNGVNLNNLKISFTGQSTTKIGVDIDADVSGSISIDSTNIITPASSTGTAIGINSNGILELNINNSLIEISRATEESYGIRAFSQSQTTLRVTNTKINISAFSNTNTGISLDDVEGTNVIIDNNKINIRNGETNIGLDLFVVSTTGGRILLNDSTIDTELSFRSLNNIGLNARSFNGAGTPTTEIFVNSSSITGSIPISESLKCFSSNNLVTNLEISCQPLTVN